MKAPLAGALLGLGLGAGLLLPAALSGGLPARGDLPDFFWPMKAYTASRWAAGEVPLWNPLSGCGEPWLAQLQTGVFYPPDLVFLLPGAAGPFASIAFHLALAAAGMAVWLSDLGRSRLASLVGAAVWAGGGAFVSLIPVLNNFATAAWLPWVFLGAQRAVRGEGVTTLGAVSALAFLGGEPALAASGTLAAVAVSWASRREEPGLGGVVPGLAPRRLAAGLLLAAGLAATAALPFAELLLESGRLTNVAKEEALARAVGRSDLADIVWPPPPSIASARRRARRLPRDARAGAARVSPRGGGCGGARRPAALRPGPSRRGRSRPRPVARGEGGARGDSLGERRSPRGLRFPARWVVFPHLVLAFLAGAGVDGWRRESPDARERLFGAAALFLGALLLVLALLDPARRAGDGAVRGAVAFAAAAGGAVLLVLLAGDRGRRRRRGAAGCSLLLVAAPLPWFAADAVAAVPASEALTLARIGSGPSAGDAGRLFVSVHDAHLLSRFVTSGTTRSLVEKVRRAHAAMAGYGNLRAGVATAGTASPIENPRRARLLGAALGGGDAATLLSLADVRALITPYPTTIPGALLTRGADGVLRYALPAGAGRVLFVREVRAAAATTTSGRP